MAVKQMTLDFFFSLYKKNHLLFTFFSFLSGFVVQLEVLCKAFDGKYYRVAKCVHFSIGLSTTNQLFGKQFKKKSDGSLYELNNEYKLRVLNTEVAALYGLVRSQVFVGCSSPSLKF